MSILNAEYLGHGFGDRAIFQGASFCLLKGRHTGPIRASGEGRPTLMNTITGKLMSDEGRVEWAKNAKAGYLDQHTVLEKDITIHGMLKSAFASPFEMEEHMNQTCDKMSEAGEGEMTAMMDELGIIQNLLMAHDFYITDSKVEEVGCTLGLTDIGLDKDVIELPGGQRTKVLLDKPFLGKPDILLLGESTNYLDTQHVDWLRRYLQEYENIFTLISHDIPFLNSATNLIYYTGNQRFDHYVGGYNKLREVYAVKESQLGAAYKRQQQEITELEGFVARNKARVATRDMAMSRQKKLDKMDVIEPAREESRPEFHFIEARTPNKCIFEAKDLVIGYDGPLSHPLNLVMERGQKIMPVDASGIGKTTLLESMLGLTPALSGIVELGGYLSIGYFGQEIAPGNIATRLQEIWNGLSAYAQYQVRSALVRYDLIVKHIGSQVRVLGGGKQVRVRLRELINRKSNVLSLDEPTNHLDVDAKDELKRALKEYKNSILLICYEPEFFKGLAADAWNCREWVLRPF